MSSLFISPYAPAPCIVCFDTERVWSESLETEGREYESFFESIHTSLKAHDLDWDDIDRIFLICGPAGFSATRVTTLMISTLRYVYPDIEFYSLDRFALAHALDVPYPMILDANRAEYLFACAHDDWSLIPKSEIISGYDMVSDPLGYISSDSLIQLCAQTPERLIALAQKVIYFRPLYIKKPNITFSSAHQSIKHLP